MVASVVVVGAGVVGAAVAASLASAGLSVRILDQSVPGGAVSGASLACIGAHMMDEEELPFLIWCCDAWARLAADRDDFEYDRCGQIRFIATEGEARVAAHWVAHERAQGLRPEILDPAGVRRIEPELTGPTLGATWSPDDATVNPFLAVRRLLAQAQAHGAIIMKDCAVIGIETTAGRVSGVRTAQGVLAADIVVLATGPWSARLAATAGLDLPIEARKAQCLATTRQPPRIRGVVGACKSEGGVDAGYTQIQQARSGQILFNTVLAGGVEAAAGNPDAVPEVDPLFVRDSVATLLRLFPGFATLDLLRSWVRFEAVTPDDRFLAGPTTIPGLYLAAGDGGVGFIRAPGLGRLIADHVLGREPFCRGDLFDPMRFAVAA